MHLASRFWADLTEERWHDDACKKDGSEAAGCHSRHDYAVAVLQIMQIIQEYLAIALPHGPSRLNNIGDTLVATLLTAEFH